MNNSEIILQYCKEANKPVTARQIIDARFPGKPQPYINGTINRLVQNKELIREGTRPYTIRLPRDGEVVHEPDSYTRESRNARPMVMNGNIEPVIPFTETDLLEAELRVMGDPRYGEEFSIIDKCFKKYPDNVDGDTIAMKMALVDMTHSTNLNKHLGKIYLTQLISKISSCDFDSRVASGDASLISELSRDKVNLFSFFSKYCLYHNYCVHGRDNYAIFDKVMKKSLGRFISHYIYKDKQYLGAQIHNCIEKMRLTYDYEGYLKLIDTILDKNCIRCEKKHRRFDWFVWYNNRIVRR